MGVNIYTKRKGFEMIDTAIIIMFDGKDNIHKNVSMFCCERDLDKAETEFFKTIAPCTPDSVKANYYHGETENGRYSITQRTLSHESGAFLTTIVIKK